MHDDEVRTDAAQVRRLLAAQLPQWAELPIRPVPSSGTDNALYRLGDELVVRLPRIDWAVDDVHKEQEWLPRLAPHLPVQVPVPVALGAPGDGYPWHWSVYRWLAGSNPPVGTDLAVEVGGFVGALHAFDVVGAAPRGSREVPLQERDEDTRAAIAAAADELDVPAVIAEWEAALAAPGPVSTVLIHADLSPGNLLLVDGRLSAVIDFGCLTVGDPACDLLPAWNLLPAAARAAFRGSVGADDAMWARGRGWALSVALIQLPYYRERSPQLAAGARHVIRELLASG